ncbi:MAG: 60S ribosomal export protein NMD3 [bacterium]
MNQMCVECGAEVPRLIGGCCPACFVKNQPLLVLPQVLDVELCAHCDARHVGNHWFDPEADVGLDSIREDAVRAEVRVHEQVRSSQVDVVEKPQDERNFLHSVTLRGDVDGVDVYDQKQMLVRMKRGVCDRCSRMFGGFYAAIVQLRATDRDVTEREIELAHKFVGEELDRQRASGNREAFLTKSGPVPAGFDYYLGDIEGTRAIARILGEKLKASVAETAKLSGRREGEDIYRVTFLVRIRLYSVGDFARVGDEGLVQVLSIDRGKALVIDIGTHKRDKVEEATLRRLGGPEILQQAVLVSEDAGSLQVLDPVTLHTVDLPRPEGYVPEGGSVWVLRHDGALYLPPLGPSGLPRGTKAPPPVGLATGNRGKGQGQPRKTG